MNLKHQLSHIAISDIFDSICFHLKKFFSLISEFDISILHKNHQFLSEQAGEQRVFLDV